MHHHRDQLHSPLRPRAPLPHALQPPPPRRSCRCRRPHRSRPSSGGRPSRHRPFRAERPIPRSPLPLRAAPPRCHCRGPRTRRPRLPALGGKGYLAHHTTWPWVLQATEALVSNERNIEVVTGLGSSDIFAGIAASAPVPYLIFVIKIENSSCYKSCTCACTYLDTVFDTRLPVNPSLTHVMMKTIYSP
jgi:hypothetical protein